MVERSLRSRQLASPWPVGLPAEPAGHGLTVAEVSAIIGLEPEWTIVSPMVPHGGAPSWLAARSVRLAELLAIVHAMLGRDGTGWLRAPNAALGYRPPIALLVDDPDALPRLCHLLREEAAC